MSLNEDEERELSALVEEMNLSDFERRRRRCNAARQRLQDLAEVQGYGGLADALDKERNGEPLSDDEFIVTHLGFTKQDVATGEPARELQRRGFHRTVRFGNGEPISELEQRNITHTIRFGDGNTDAEPDKS